MHDVINISDFAWCDKHLRCCMMWYTSQILHDVINISDFAWCDKHLRFCMLWYTSHILHDVINIWDFVGPPMMSKILVCLKIVSYSISIFSMSIYLISFISGSHSENYKNTKLQETGGNGIFIALTLFGVGNICKNWETGLFNNHKGWNSTCRES